jgi:hypothetical protein
LREAILISNRTLSLANLSAEEQQLVVGTPLDTDADTIAFIISGPVSGVQTIALTASLPAITDPVTIDGYTQPEASANTLAVGSNAALRIELNGVNSGNADGLTLNGGNTTIRGLVINRFSTAITINSGGNVIEGNYLGTDPTGNVELGNSGAGVRVFTGVGNRIGGVAPQARNVLVGNSSGNIVIAPNLTPQPVDTVVRGNYIGTNPAGTAALHTTAGGADDGIAIISAANTIVGGDDDDDGQADGVVLARNVISGNSNGIRLDPSSAGARITGLTIQGNFIGANATGTAAIGNFGDGIFAGTAINTTNLQVGGTTPGAGNIIAASAARGFGGGGLSMVMEGNLVGTDITGTLDFGNGTDGVHIALGGSGSPDFQVLVGGNTPAARNLISGNNNNGVLITGLIF